ncbi:hypothetical protein QR680_010064 [Steinernema hermaphroditum]|uniref:Major facilitator superfamily (MFS) profile domain-containing protein n=1 Tax=Steinernema hermaphroditum TaxID=289476 RepID=A0AA39IP94_9BILA|nr:hypothetical protein QR680_010064 [Steinernema hermaphroditum]
MNNYATAPKTDWRSLYIASFISFCAAVQYGLYFSSLWPYLKIIDPDITEQFFGVIIAAYSMAACFSSPLFGYWSNRAKRVSVPMKAGIISMFTGNVIYLSCELLPSHRRYALCVARFLVGVGSANIPLLRAYASTSCHPKDRPRATAFVTGGIAIGIMIGPAIQACFTSISYPGLIIFRNFSISMYTASAYGACFMNALSFVCLQFFFVEKYSGIHKENAQQTKDERTVPKFDRLAAFICNFTRFTQQFTFTNVEILGAPYAMTVFAFTKYDTVQYGSLAQSGMGIMGVSFFVLFIAFKLNKYVKYRIGNITAFGLMLLFHLATYPWPFLQTKIETYTDNDFLNTTEEIVGCNTDHFGWCTTTPRVNPWVYYISFMVFVGVGYPLIDLCLHTVYGRVLGPRRQGTMQGILQVSSAVARIIGPLSISVLYRTLGPKVIWLVEIGVIVVTILLWVIFYKRLVVVQVVPVTDSNVSVTDTSAETNATCVENKKL